MIAKRNYNVEGKNLAPKAHQRNEGSILLNSTNTYMYIHVHAPISHVSVKSPFHIHCIHAIPSQLSEEIRPLN